MTARIAYVDGPRLARSLFAAADWVAAGRDEINRINVFPVPDGDTGTNFSLTLRAVADALRALGDAPLPETAKTMARASVLGARGNSGMMLAHFLMGFAESVGDKRTATVVEVAAAIRRGADKLEQSLDEPREGTILTVAREAANSAERAAATTNDIGDFMLQMLRDGEVALANTPELMAVLKQAGVVDAGGMGFVRMLEGVVRFIEGDPILPGRALPGRRARLLARRARRRRRRARLPLLHRGAGPRGAAAAGQRGATGDARVRRVAGRRDGVGHPEDPCAYRHPRRRLYLCSALGPGRGDQGRRHAGPAPEAGPPGAPPGGRRL